MKVTAKKDLFDDNGQNLMVLAGTTGKIICEHAAADGHPAGVDVTFSDGVSIFCVMDELELDECETSH